MNKVVKFLTNEGLKLGYVLAKISTGIEYPYEYAVWVIYCENKVHKIAYTTEWIKDFEYCKHYVAYKGVSSKMECPYLDAIINNTDISKAFDTTEREIWVGDIMTITEASVNILFQ